MSTAHYRERDLKRIRHFEELPITQTSLATLKESLWQRFVSSFSSGETIETAVIKRNLLAETLDGDVRASVLGILMCSEEPRRHLPNAYIQATRYRGTHQDSKYRVDAKDLTGPLDEQISGAMSFLNLNQRIAATKLLGRVDVPQFSKRAVFEAIVNAVAHRDYSISHSKIRFFIFDDRLEIFVPGNLTNSMSVDSLPLRTATRNERITNLLAKCQIPENNGDFGQKVFMERRGGGVSIIINESLKHSGRKPKYRLIDDAELQLTIYSARLPNQL